MGKKVVIDTNTLISALGWKGNPHKVLQKVTNGEIELIISFEQFDELSKVLDYPRLRFSEEQKQILKDLILEVAKFVKPLERVTVVRDKLDNMIIEEAIAGKADYIITGDRDLHDLGRFRNIKIVTAREFLDI